eukprot:TRINITY_DN17356_c0_g1_i1.p1 TRINITY_DN17356_c0_g1~~TRINITY_DN17356_c0_g1_i1.p1  ORF type:complete len:244 (-),score=48.61 TRINITY_DN17356_c0_g1_i1:27-758(-)
MLTALDSSKEGLRFLIERIENNNKQEWKDFATQAKQDNENLFSSLPFPKKEDSESYYKSTRDAINMFSDHLSLGPCPEKWVVFVSCDTSNLDDVRKNRNDQILMSMTLTSCSDCSLVKHMGIFRNPRKRNQHKDLAVLLHSFAAHSMLIENPLKKFMYSYPLNMMKKKIISALPPSTNFYCQDYRGWSSASTDNPLDEIKEHSQNESKCFWIELGTPAKLFIIRLEDLANLFTFSKTINSTHC